MMGEFRYGTSSWSEKSWVGSFYPAGTSPAAFLGYYATQFDTVEADNTYYAVPAAPLVEGWRAKTPDGFRLAAKFPRSIVHCGEGPRPDATKLLVPDAVYAERDGFLGAMRLLGDRCGPLVLQFPYFNRTAFPEYGPFLERLDAFLGDLPDDFRYAVEIRNKNWVGEKLLDVLRRNRTAFVWTEVGYMPHPAALARRLDIRTADFVYARLIGDRAATERATDTFDRVVLDKRKSLERWAELLRPAIEEANETFAFANNHYAGHGPGTIRELAELVAGAGAE